MGVLNSVHLEGRLLSGFEAKESDVRGDVGLGERLTWHLLRQVVQPGDFLQAIHVFPGYCTAYGHCAYSINLHLLQEAERDL